MDYKQRYEFWKNHQDLDENLRKELETLSEKDIEDAFFQDIHFETAGLRGIMGVGSNRLNIHTVRKATLGVIKYFLKTNRKSVAISYDNRYNSRDYALDTAKMFAGYGIKVYLAKELRPTPELSFMVRYYKCDGGIMITASHNPKEYNGYKIYDETGCQFIPEFAEKVAEEIETIDDIIAIKLNNYDESLIIEVSDEVDRAYYDNVLSISIRKDLDKNFRIAFSSEHGASYIPVMTTLKEAGFDVYDVKEQAVFDPAFSNTKSPNPEEKDSYELVLKLAKEIDAELLLVCDPDGDRMGVGVKHNGEYVILNGNQTGAVLLEYILSSMEDMNISVNNPCMYNTVVTSDIGMMVARKHNCDVEQTLTGFKYIGDKVRKYEVNNEKDYVFGYEESYGSLIKPFVRDKDATQACLMLSEACAYYRTAGKTLIDALYDIYETVGYYGDSQVSIKLPGATGALKLKEIMINLRKEPITFEGYKTLKTEDYLNRTVTYCDGRTEALNGYDRSDVIKYFLDDGSFVAIRPSGTEPKCKAYLCAKGSSVEDFKNKLDYFAVVVKERFK